MKSTAAWAIVHSTVCPQCLRFPFTRWPHCIEPIAATSIHPAASHTTSAGRRCVHSLEIWADRMSLCVRRFFWSSRPSWLEFSSARHAASFVLLWRSGFASLAAYRAVWSCHAPETMDKLSQQTSLYSYKKNLDNNMITYSHAKYILANWRQITCTTRPKLHAMNLNIHWLKTRISLLHVNVSVRLPCRRRRRCPLKSWWALFGWLCSSMILLGCPDTSVSDVPRFLPICPSRHHQGTKFSRPCFLNTCPRKTSCRWRILFISVRPTPAF